MIPLLVVFATAALVAWGITLRVQELARRYQIMDVPNERSSHKVATPRGGGVAIAAVVILGSCILIVTHRVEMIPFGVAIAAGLVVAWVGFMDDRHGLSRRLRLAVQLCATGSVLAGAVTMGTEVMPPFRYGWMLPCLMLLLGALWLINLFNFMDGIDGLAGAEAVFVSLGIVACVHVLDASPSSASFIGVLIAGATSGFLIHNWPPARIFMGDAGSAFLGFVIGALALVAHLESGITMWAPVILLGAFVTDATITLLRRMVRGERWYEPHREHAYQHLARRAGAHRPVTVGFVLTNLVWLFPLAIVATRKPSIAWACATLAYSPLVIAALLAGAGRTDMQRRHGQ